MDLYSQHPHVKPSPERFTYSETSGDLEVRVRPEFLPRQSRPDQHIYAWSYHVTVTNRGSRRLQLMRRHWIITDGRGHTEEVNGEGVIGEQPILLPNTEYTYSSGCPLRTATGNMRGWYEMIDLDSRERLRAKIPLFFLRQPSALH